MINGDLISVKRILAIISNKYSTNLELFLNLNKVNNKIRMELISFLIFLIETTKIKGKLHLNQHFNR